MYDEPVPRLSSSDRRASVRYSCSEEGFGSENSCRPITAMKKEVWPAAVRDMSTGGVGILVNRRFEPGTLLSVELQDAEKTAARTLLVRVVRLTQQDKDHWLLGCAFTSKLSESELLTLM